ncbi:MAG: orotidine-5'-phosphate decarboxylase [Bacteroides sp.]|nr:orotidine-5'-phosphate decarboxylase [Bacteroides sp.]MCM1086257.1 orotidine-5'-phosphate decarboxylase [Bacteroides sp.]
MNRQQLIEQIHAKKSFLCVGLDPDMDKIPACVKGAEDPVFEFNRRIIDATLPYAVAYKPNSAFYEAYGIKGMLSLQKTVDYLRDKNVFTIADAKRGDIGNTSARYAKAFLSKEGGFDFDALTVAPYMGSDSVQPFLQEEGKWVILLALTSNAGSADFQTCPECNPPLYQKVLAVSRQWGTPRNMMYVVGATQADMLKEIRRIVPEHFLLVPGVGAQGGSLEDVCRNGLIKNDIGLLINASRSILYASKGEDFASAAAQEAERMQQEMSRYV